MALSNWAICAWDQRGKISNGVFTIGKVSVEIYKSWAYLKDEDAWTKNSSFIKPIISQIVSAQIDYSGLDIYAKTGIGDAIYLVANYHNYKKKIDRTMFGIGCYAYDGKGNQSGVTKIAFDDFVKWVGAISKDNIIKVVLPKKPRWFNQGDNFFAGGKFKLVSYPVGKIGGKSVFEKLINNKIPNRPKGRGIFDVTD